MVNDRLIKTKTTCQCLALNKTSGYFTATEQGRINNINNVFCLHNI